MIRASDYKDLINAIIRLESEKDFQTFKSWIFDSCNHYLENLPLAGRKTNAEGLPQMIDSSLTFFEQGRVCNLQDIRDVLRDVHLIKEKMEKRNATNKKR